MPVYSYKGFDTRGKPASGVRDADNLRALRAALKRDGVLLTEAKEASLRAKAAGEAAAVGLVALVNPISAIKMWQERETADKIQDAVINRQLGVLLKAGLPLS